MADLGPLIGTPSKLTILDDEGRVIVKEGGVITYGVITRAKEAGRLDDLRMSAAMAAGEAAEIKPASEYEEIGEEEPEGAYPE